MFSLIILLLLKLSLRQTQQQHLIWIRLCLIVSDEEENHSDITYVESTDEESDNILNNPLQHVIVQQGPNQQRLSHQGPSQHG